jgi:outer membrane protein TolC
MHRIPAVTTTCLLGMLAGCQHYQATPLEPRGTAASFAAQRLDDPQLRQALALMPHGNMAVSPLKPALEHWPLEHWNRAQLLTVALLRNPELAASRAAVDVALAQERAAARKISDLGLTLESEYARQESYRWLYGLGLALPLPTRTHRLERQIAGLDSGIARWQYLDQTWSIRQELVDALHAWEGTRRRLAVLDRLTIAEQQLLTLERNRVQAGEDAPTLILPIDAARIDVDRQCADARTDLAAAQATVAKTLGLPPTALDGLQLDWPEWGDPPPADTAAASEQALLSRSDLALAIQEYGVAEKRLELAIARQYPQWEFQPGYYWDHGIAKLPLDMGLRLPFDGNRGEIATARAARELAARRMLALQADIYGHIAAAARAEQLDAVSVDTAQRALLAARRQASAEALGVQVGATGSDQSLAADIPVLRAELELLQARTQRQAARNHLEDVLHTPLSGPELALVPPVPQPLTPTPAATPLPGTGS